MYKTHPYFPEPDENLVLWRCMPLDKFHFLLASSLLYFCAADKFEDPFEATLPKRNREEIRAMEGNGLDSPFVKEIKHFKSRTGINCWHVNEYESVGMWKLYKSMKADIAIQTTYRKLRKAITDDGADVYISEVQYLDYETAYIDPKQSQLIYVSKRKGFAHEKEVRAITSTANDEVTRQLNDMEEFH